MGRGKINYFPSFLWYCSRLQFCYDILKQSQIYDEMLLDYDVKNKSLLLYISKITPNDCSPCYNSRTGFIFLICKVSKTLLVNNGCTLYTIEWTHEFCVCYIKSSSWDIFAFVCIHNCFNGTGTVISHCNCLYFNTEEKGWCAPVTKITTKPKQCTCVSDILYKYVLTVSMIRLIVPGADSI